MKSDDVTFWIIVKHIFGFHTWSEVRQWKNPDCGPNILPVYYRNCEICGIEQVRTYDGYSYFWQTRKEAK